MPDYHKIAQDCVDKDDVERELREAHEKGYSSGYVDGGDFGWVDALEGDDDWERATLEDAVPEDRDLYHIYNRAKDTLGYDDPEEEL